MGIAILVGLGIGVLIVVVVIVLGGAKPPKGGGPGKVPGAQDLGDCKVGGHVTHNKTLEECRDMGGQVFSPNDPTLQSVNPQTGNPIDE